MKNENMPAMPVNEYKQLGDVISSTNVSQGLTKREQVVKDFMCSLATETSMPEHLAYLANELADAYFESLEK